MTIFPKRDHPIEEPKFENTPNSEELIAYKSGSESLNPLIDIIDCNETVREELVKYFYRKCADPRKPKMLWYPNASIDLNDFAQLSKYESKNYHGVSSPEIFVHSDADAFFINDLISVVGNDPIEIECQKQPINSKKHWSEKRKYRLKLIDYEVFNLIRIGIGAENVNVPGLNENEIFNNQLFLFNTELSWFENKISDNKLFYFVYKEIDFLIDFFLAKGAVMSHLARNRNNNISGWSYPDNKEFR